MHKRVLILVLSLLLIENVLSNDSNDLYDLILHPHDRGAYCLDGSPAGMYIHEGTGKNKNKFMIFMEGGGDCGADSLAQTLQACYKRSFTDLGSTSNAPKKYNFENWGLLSTNPTKNPVFHDWTKVYIIYCDGASHQGYRQNPIPYKKRNIYVRGRRNTLEHFYYLDKHYDFYNQDTIVLTGISAGGIGVFAWAQHLYENTKSSKVVAIPDSGIFIEDFESPTAHRKVSKEQTANLLKFIGDDELVEPIKECFQVEGSKQDCYELSNYIKYIRPPVFMIQSTYDEWVLDYLIIVECVTNNHQPFSISTCNESMRASIEDYHNIWNKYVNKMREDKKYLGVWGAACIQHGFVNQKYFTSEKYEVNNIKIYEGIQKFLDDPMNPPWILDQGLWPSANAGCNGLSYNIRQE